STVTWTIYRDPALTQGVDLVENDPLPVEDSVEQPFDRLTMIAQRINDRLDRTLQQPEGDTANMTRLPAKVTRAGKFLAFDDDGNPEAADGTEGTTGSLAVALAATGASKGAALVGFLQSGSGAVAETLQAKIRRGLPFEPQDFMTAAQKADVAAYTYGENVT